MIKRNIFTGAVIGAAMTALVASSALAQQGPGGDRLLDVIVVMDEGFAPGGHGANKADAANFARGLGINPRYTYGTALFGFAASVPQAVMDALENNPRVKYVELDGTAFAIAPKFCGTNPDHKACAGDGVDDPPPPLPPPQVTPWGIKRTGADTSAHTGVGVHAYVLDTGIDMDHADLTNVDIDNSVNCTGGKGGRFATPTCNSGGNDGNGHGTHVAGTIGAPNNGIGVVGMAPDVTLHAVQVLKSSGSGSFSGINAGIDWIAANRILPAVANMSLGGSGSKTGTCTAGVFTGTGSMHEAICNATNEGVVFVVAAGNSDDDADSHVPAAYDDTVITVSATMETDDWPYWSNFGSVVDIAAPGVGVLSTWNDGGTNTISGTSMASPHVAGAVALWLESNVSSLGFDAFTDARADLLSAAELTDYFSDTSGNTHNEPF
ncbi:MAG: S8 family serine peptidase, partial [Alphaproteobacteria bacterium]|nr:S8 family serine peptidase [Alphaproteobacteria bacterium]